MNLENLTINKIHQGLIKKDFSAVELARAYLDRIKAEDKKIGAFLQVDKEMALSQARAADRLVKQGKASFLTGSSAAIKDNILVKDLKCTAGSKILENYKAPFDATVIKKLKQEEVIILGKANLDEFAMGSSTEHSAFQKTKNPRDLTRVPGGSSGGPAAAVAAGFCSWALGSDTGGSIRQPASFCGVVGLKPTYGAVSRYGLIAFASSLDQLGPIANNVEDCEAVFNVIKGKDPLDSTSVRPGIGKPSPRLTDLSIGIPREYFKEGIEKGVKKVVEEVIEKAEKQGADIVEISLPHTKYAIACYYIIATSEASANLARYDGIRYGPRAEAKDLLGVYLKTKGEGFGDEVKRRIMLGTYALSSGYYDAYYLRAQKVRNLIKQDFSNAFAKVDVIFAPTSPFPAFKIGEKIDNPLKMYLSDVFTAPANLAGIPAISLPVGEVEGLPVGLQVLANHFEEAKIFKVAKDIEKLI